MSRGSRGKASCSGSGHRRKCQQPPTRMRLRHLAADLLRFDSAPKARRPERGSGGRRSAPGRAGLRRQLRKNRGPVPKRPGSARAREGPDGRLCLAIVPDPATPPAASHPRGGGKRRGAAADQMRVAAESQTRDEPPPGAHRGAFRQMGLGGGRAAGDVAGWRRGGRPMAHGPAVVTWAWRRRSLHGTRTFGCSPRPFRP